MDIDGDISRRDYAKVAGLSAIAAAGGLASTSASIADLLSEDSSGDAEGGPVDDTPAEPEGYSPGELNNWDSIEKCLSTEQEESVTEVVERYSDLSRNDLRYSVETDGNVLIHEPSEDGYRPIAETKDNDFMCDINY